MGAILDLPEMRERVRRWTVAEYVYAEAGVAEYWIVLGETQRVEVYRRPVEDVYREQRTYVRGEIIEGVGVTMEAVPVDALFT